MTRLVLDASVPARAYLPGQIIPATHAVLRAGTLFAPAILRQEFFNAAWRAERRGLLPAAGLDTVLRDFDALPIEFVDSPDWVGRALAVARRFDQPNIFDAIYLACAEDLDADLWTCDRRFVASFGADRPQRVFLCPVDVAGRP